MRSAVRGAACLSALLLLLLSPAHSSEGDRSGEYRACEHECKLGCQGKPPQWQGLIRWSCASNCSYSCMQHVQAQWRARGLRTVKFHGKWPFTRVLGLQEVCASLFSLTNMLPHAYYAIHPPWPAQYSMKHILRGYSFIGTNTWIWAAVYHARETKFTEAADYFSAIAGISYVLWSGIARLPLRTPYIYFSGVLLSVHLIYHISTMLRQFDYGYNMKIGLVIAVLNLAVWGSYLWRIRHRNYSRNMGICLLLINAAIAFELLDFPPISGLLDAHATWHLSTTPLTYWWYQCLIRDAQWDVTHGSDEKTG
jgi:hypothetical protein